MRKRIAAVRLTQTLKTRASNGTRGPGDGEGGICMLSCTAAYLFCLRDANCAISDKLHFSCRRSLPCGEGHKGCKFILDDDCVNISQCRKEGRFLGFWRALYFLDRSHFVIRTKLLSTYLYNSSHECPRMHQC